MKRKFLTGVLSVLLYFTVALSMISVTYAWLCNGKGVDLNVKGTAIANYFHSGTGTENDPYILTTPRHVYNLAWLQYLGTFNDITDGKLNAQVYFELGGNINMADGADAGYQTIPPIGTSEYPFLGNFDGKGFNISNAIVANKIGSDGLVAHPPVIDDVRYSEIIGFFGIVGDYTGAVELTSTQLKALEVKNLTLTDVTIKTSTTKSLAGLFAGYVNGNISNINVVSGDITVNSGVLPYTEKLSETNTINDTLSMSKYALIGDYHTTRINWVGGPGSVSTDSGDNTGWGGSIDMLTLAKRITYMFDAAATTTLTTSPKFTLMNSDVSKNNHAYVHLIATGTKYDYEETSPNVLVFRNKTYLPLNIDLKDFGQNQYNSASVESVLSTNTGYIVGKNSNSTKTDTINLRNRVVGQLCNSMQGGSPVAGDWKTLLYTNTMNSQMQILTKTAKGDYVVIGDDINGLTSASTPYAVYANVGIGVQTYTQLGLTQYDSSTTNNVRNKVATMLAANQNLIGLHFPAYYPPSIATQGTAADAGVITLDTPVSLGGTDVNSLVQGTIQFAVQEKGVITLAAATVCSSSSYIAGEWQSKYKQTPADSYLLPRLYQVERDKSSGQIIAIHVIDAICRNIETGELSYTQTLVTKTEQRDGETYTYMDAPDGWELVYYHPVMGRLTYADTAGINLACMQSLFYFEIPVNAGEYIFGGNQDAQSPFIVYLDIGANAGEDFEETPDGGDGTGGTGTPEDSDEKGTIEGVAFAYKSGNLYVQITKTVKDGNNQDVAIVVTFDFSLKDKSSNAHTGATAEFTGTAPTGSNAASVTTSNNNTGQFTITENDTGSG